MGSYEPEYIELDKRLRKKYAKAFRTFELGIYGYNANLIKCLTLTTALDSRTRVYRHVKRERNTWRQLVQDNRDMRKVMRKEGILAEDCFCVEISPRNHLLHMHGFYRLQHEIDSDGLHEVVSRNWLKCHDAKVVWVKNMWDMDGAIKYDVKHALKNYVSDGYNSMRLIKSRMWLPRGWREAERALVRFALDKTETWLNEDDPYYQEGWNEHYLYDRWGVMKDLRRRWAEGEELLLEFGSHYEILHGDSLVSFPFSAESIVVE